MNTQDFITTICILSLCVPSGLVIKHLIVKHRIQLIRFKADLYDFFCNISERIADDCEVYEKHQK